MVEHPENSITVYPGNTVAEEVGCFLERVHNTTKVHNTTESTQHNWEYTTQLKVHNTHIFIIDLQVQDAIKKLI
jgi:hypothetical protein